MAQLTEAMSTPQPAWGRQALGMSRRRTSVMVPASSVAAAAPNPVAVNRYEAEVEVHLVYGFPIPLHHPYIGVPPFTACLGTLPSVHVCLHRSDSAERNLEMEWMIWKYRMRHGVDTEAW